ncbi:L-serine ammonia-lyase, iron-sulfur-dependent, subunit alpha [Senegalimassilia faecalis]|uniref:L-serine ammonia-lyase, iron-sulfur-dependent, subunit alpha n=1 Tax=Senegalimassilia faecalis TaxID=2509433 RepID=UPI003A96B61B
METLGLTDIIGPVMVGPSSSHTAGALRIAYMARKLAGSLPRRVEFRLLGSFAHTLTGHGTDKALVAGMLGFSPDDLRIRNSFAHAREAGLHFEFTPLPDSDDYEHPNTIDMVIDGADGVRMCVRGESVGGGAAVIRKIDGVDVYITGENHSIVVQQIDEPGVLAHIATCLSEHGVNIATARMYREQRGDVAYTVLETDQSISEDAREAIIANPLIRGCRVIPAATEAGEAPAPVDADVQTRALEDLRALDFGTGRALLELCRARKASISEMFFRREQAVQESRGFADGTQAYLLRVLRVMKDAAFGPLDEPANSMGGLLGGEAQRMAKLRRHARNVCGEPISSAAAYAMAVLETNASMGRIVAAPTAGSAGVIPGVLLSLQATKGFTDDELVRALGCAAAVGYLITRNATVAGAEGGCQAEIGSAAAMAAAATVELEGGTPEQCLDAAGNALTNMMGLVCDPVAGLVEVPCQKRNASGAATALVSAQISLANVGNLVGFDQTVEAMYKVGRSLPFELRESALGGLAATPDACAWCESHMCGK